MGSKKRNLHKNFSQSWTTQQQAGLKDNISWNELKYTFYTKTIPKEVLINIIQACPALTETQKAELVSALVRYMFISGHNELTKEQKQDLSQFLYTVDIVYKSYLQEEIYNLPKKAENTRRSINPATIYYACGNCEPLSIPLISSQHKLDPKASRKYEKRQLKAYLPIVQGTKYRKIAQTHTQRGLRFLTLSYKGGLTLPEAKEELQNLRDSCNRFERRKYINKRIYAFIRVFELKLTAIGYYLHAHYLMDSEYLNNQNHKTNPTAKAYDETKLSKLANEWYEATGNLAYNADVRLVRNILNFSKPTLQNAVKYLLKYVCKSPMMSPMDQVEYSILFNKKRLISRGGEWYGIKLTIAPSYCKTCGCPYTFLYVIDAPSPETFHIISQTQKPPPSLPYEFQFHKPIIPYSVSHHHNQKTL